VDEIWTFNYCKQGNLTPEIAERVPNAGDLWLWVAIDADTKLVPCVRLGGRTASDAHEFMQDLSSRLSHRVQLTTDGFRPYLTAVDRAFGVDIDYATLTKWYGAEMPNERRYSPPVVLSTIKKVVTGDPDEAHISTSYVERQNWTLRTTRCAATRGCRMASHARSRTTWPPWP
jgi:hypothetical protein